MTSTPAMCLFRLLAIAALLLLSACGINDEPEPTPVVTIPIDNPPEPVSRVILQLMLEGGTSPDQVGLVGFSPELWPDASMGCPQAGMTYAQVLTSGYSITLLVNGDLREYRTDMQGNAVRCD